MADRIREQAAALLPLWQDYQSQQAAEDFDTEQAESLLADIERIRLVWASQVSPTMA